MSNFSVTTKFYTPELLQTNQDKIFIFGDNLIGIGCGGQAVIRNEPNAYGIPTKIFPLEGDFVYLQDRSDAAYMKHMFQFYDNIFNELEDIAYNMNYEIVFPSGGLGTGLSHMPEFAPKLLAYIDLKVSALIGSDYTKWREPDESR